MGSRFSRRTWALGAAIASVLGARSVLAFDQSASKFTLIAVPDPQYYTVVQWKTDQYLNTQMNWIVSNATTNNIGFVFGLGDEVQDGNPYTTDPVTHQITTTYTGNIIPQSGTPAVNGAPSINTVDPTTHDFEMEWKRASSAWRILDNANIPNYPIAGNHDYYHWDQKKDPSEWVKYFNYGTRYAGKSWYGGYSPANTSTNTSVKAFPAMNTYSYFNAGGYKFLNIAVQFQADAGDLAWAQSLIDANKGIPTILTTHDYQDTNGRDGAGNNIWNGLVNKAGNSQIFMVLSGHVNGTHQQISTDADGKPVMEILSDYQDYGFGTSQGYSKAYANGGGFLRTMGFDLDAKTVTVQTYSPYIASQGDNGFLTTRSGTGANADAFTLNFDMAARFGPPTLLAGQNFFWDPSQTHSNTGGGSGSWDQSASASWFQSGGSNSFWSAATINDTAIFGGSAGTVTIAAGGVTANDLRFKVPGYVITGGPLAIGGFQPTIDNTNGAATISSNMDGSAGVFVVGGSVTFSGSNTFTGGLNVGTNATVRWSVDSNLGAASQSVSIDGGTLTYTGTGPITENQRAFTVGANGATLDSVNTGNNGKLVINGNNKIQGAGNITKTGPGWLTLYGSNSFSGNWIVNNGVVEVGGNGVLGSGSVTMNNGGELGANVTTLANPVALNNGATIGTDFPTAGTTCNFTAPIVANGAVNVRLGNFWSNLSQNVTFSNKLSGGGTLSTIAALGATTSTGKLLLAADNSSYSGNLVINAGTVASGLVAGNALGSGQVFLKGGKLALQGQLAPTGAPGSIGAIPVAGFNKDTVYSVDESAKYPSGDNTNNTLLDGSFSFFENGFTPGEGYLNQGETLAGGFVSNAITSAVNSTPFAMQDFNGSNTLQIDHGSSSSLTLNTKAGLTRLSVLANAVFGANDNPTITINFADGTSVTTTYKAFDWSLGTDSARSAADAFGSTGTKRYSPTQSPGLDTKAMGIYETDIDLTNLAGVDYSTKLISSLTFTAAIGDGLAHAKTNIFAVSGIARANQTSAAQTYLNPINVSADSGIDVTVSLNATVGPLSISGSKLSVTSADVTTNPYSLTFGATNVTGGATFDVASSAGGGAGSVVLGPISGSGSITKTGSGTLRLNSGGAISGPLSVNAGTTEIGASTMVGAFSITGGAKLDVAGNNLLIDYTGASPADAIRQYLLSGALFSSVGSGSPKTALGYAEASSIGLSSFAGHALDGSSLLVHYTLAGDANLDGTVNALDFSAIASNFGGSGKLWIGGDYNYDGTVNTLDFNLLAANFNNTLPGASLSLLSAPPLGTLIPEPSMGLLSLAIGSGVSLMRRRRR